MATLSITEKDALLNSLAPRFDKLKLYTIAGGTLLITLDITNSTASNNSLVFSSSSAVPVASGSPTYAEFVDSSNVVRGTATVSDDTGSGDIQIAAADYNMTTTKSFVVSSLTISFS